MSARIHISLIFLLWLFAACEDDTIKKTQTLVYGRWELAKGFRNQKETETLQGVFFHFGTDGKMTTSLPVGADAPTEFELNKNEILQKSPQPVTYRIQSATDSTLVLTMEMRGMQFEMHLVKSDTLSEGDFQPDSLAAPDDTLSR